MDTEDSVLAWTNSFLNVNKPQQICNDDLQLLPLGPLLVGDHGAFLLPQDPRHHHLSSIQVVQELSAVLAVQD